MRRILTGVITAAALGLSVAAAKAEPFEIVHTTWVGYGPLYLAQDLGYFKEEGVEVKLTTIEEKTLQMAAMMSGQAAGALGTVDEFLLYMNKDVCLKYVFALDESAGGDGIIVSKGIDKLEDLKGKQVAFNEGSVSQFWFNVVLKNHGMKQEDIEMVNMTPDDAAAALMAGRVPAAVTWEPHLTEARGTAGSKVLIDSSTTPGVITDVMAVQCSTAEKRADDIKAIIRAWNRAVDYWKANPDKANAIMAKGVGGWLADPAVFGDSVKGVKFFDKATNTAYFGTSDKPGSLYGIVQYAIDIWGGLKRLQVSPKPADIITNAYLAQ
ncbi:ABC transporter substrate-binding protein [Hypericibacter sp.]|uniref:ABC transporter substrate-binding protein n=1 Tax=Hypericibacter sp. TaxID=2705401 RepID=UPI003D6C811F